MVVFSTAALKAMREINLREYQPSCPVSLGVRERDALRRVIPSITIEPAEDEESTYILTPGSTIGAADVEDLSVLIEPKIGIPQVLSLACQGNRVLMISLARDESG